MQKEIAIPTEPDGAARQNEHSPFVALAAQQRQGGNVGGLEAGGRQDPHGSEREQEVEHSAYQGEEGQRHLKMFNEAALEESGEEPSVAMIEAPF